MVETRTNAFGGDTDMEQKLEYAIKHPLSGNVVKTDRQAKISYQNLTQKTKTNKHTLVLGLDSYRPHTILIQKMIYKNLITFGGWFKKI